MYTHDDDMATPEEQAALLDELFKGSRHSMPSHVVTITVPKSPEDRHLGRGVSVHDGTSPQDSFSSFQSAHPGGWWGVSILDKPSCSPHDHAANIMYEMLAGRIPPDIDRIAVLPVRNSNLPVAELGNELASKMITCVYDDAGLISPTPSQPGLIENDRALFPGVIGSASVSPDIFPDYAARFSQSDCDRMALRYTCSLYNREVVRFWDFARLPEGKFQEHLASALSEMERRSLGSFSPPPIPADLLTPLPEELPVLYPRRNPSPDIEKLMRQGTGFLSAWNDFAGECGVLPTVRVEAGVLTSITDAMLELGRLTPSFVGDLASVSSGKGYRRHLGNRDRSLSSLPARASTVRMTSRIEGFPPLGDLLAVPGVFVVNLVDVRKSPIATGTFSSWNVVESSFDAFEESRHIYAMVSDSTFNGPEKAVAAMLCGKVPDDAEFIVSFSGRTSSMTYADKKILDEALAELGAELLYDESGVLREPSGMARYCTGATGGTPRFSYDIPIRPDYMQELEPLWQDELLARAKEAMCGSWTVRRQLPLDGLADALSEGRLSAGGCEVPAAMRAGKTVYSTLSFLPGAHDLMPVPGQVRELVQASVLAGLWREALAAGEGFSPGRGFPASASPEMLRHIGRVSGIYPMVSAYFSGVPLEDIVGEETARKIADSVCETMGVARLADILP